MTHKRFDSHQNRILNRHLLRKTLQTFLNLGLCYVRYSFFHSKYSKLLFLHFVAFNRQEFVTFFVKNLYNVVAKILNINLL